MIAAKAGVTKSTVSNVLHRNRVGTRSDAVRNARRIRKIAAELGYRPNMAARAMQTNRYNAVGLLASTDYSRSVYRHYLPGLTRGCRRMDLHLTVGEVVDDKLADERYIPKVLREWAVDGLLIAYMRDFPEALADLIERHRIPSVWINAKRDQDCVYPDDQGGMVLATRRLIEMGHRRIAYLAGGGGRHYSSSDRRAGYAGVMIDAGLPVHDLYPPRDEPVHLTTIFDDAKAMLSSPAADRPTAFICEGDHPAMTLYHAATAAGLSVPRDLSIIGLHHAPLIGIGRDIATLRLPAEQVGLDAVDRIHAKINAPARPLEPLAVPYTLEREEVSVAPPPVAGKAGGG